MEKRGQRRTREGNCFREGSVGLTGEERRELVVEVLFLCSYRDYKDCNASNSEKSDQRPVEDPQRKTMNLARSAVQC